MLIKRYRCLFIIKIETIEIDIHPPEVVNRVVESILLLTTQTTTTIPTPECFCYRKGHTVKSILGKEKVNDLDGEPEHQESYESDKILIRIVE